MQIGFDVALPYQNGRFDLERAGTREALCLSSHQGGRIAAAKSMPGDFRNWRREVSTSWPIPRYLKITFLLRKLVGSPDRNRTERRLKPPNVARDSLTGGLTS